MDGCGAEMLRVRDPTRAWLSLFFDSKPLSGEYDQKVQLSIAPVNLKYHAPAVNGAIDVSLFISYIFILPFLFSGLQATGVCEIEPVNGVGHVEIR